MSFFEARVQATLDTSKFQSEIKKLENKAIRFNNVSFNTAKLQSNVGRTKITLSNVKIDTSKLAAQVRQALNQPFNIKITGADASKLSAQLKMAGENAGRNIQNSVSKGVNNASKSTAQFARKFEADLAKAHKAMDTKALDANIQSLKAKYEGIANSGNALNETISLNITRLGELQSEMEGLRSKGSAGAQELVAKYKEYDNVLATTKNQIKTVTAEMKQFASASQIASSQSKMTQFMESGTIAAKKYGQQVKVLSNELKALSAQGKVPASSLKRINDQFSMITVNAKASGANVQTFGSKMKGAFSKFAGYLGASTIIYGGITTIKNGINEVVELDNALVDLKKTSDGTTQQLNDFYYSANDTAKKLGTSTKEVIQSAADWSRLGLDENPVPLFGNI